MEADKKICVQIKLDDEEKKDMDVAYEILRKVRDYFYVNNMNKWCEETKIALNIISNLKNNVVFEEKLRIV